MIVLINKIYIRILFIGCLFTTSCLVDNKNSKDQIKREAISWHDSLKTQPKQLFLLDKENSDKNNGVYERYRKDGTLMSVIPLKEGKKHGLVKKYYRNRQLNFEINYKNGVENGLYRSFSKNGDLFSEGNYKNGVKEGEWKFYNDDGSLSSIEVYHNDSLINEKEYGKQVN